MQLVVDARMFSQQIVNVYYFKYSVPGSGLTAGSSTLFLTNFRATYRTNVLPLLVNTLTVSRYWLRSVHDVILKGPVGDQNWEGVYDPTRLDFLDGAGPDVGGVAPGATGVLPASNAMRVRKDPTDRRVGYFNRSYNRYAPLNVNELDADVADHDRWTAPTVNAWTLALNVFHQGAVFDQAGGNGWNHAVFSATYHGRVSKPAGLGLVEAASVVASASISPYVGTQVSRRYQPDGSFRGA